MRQFDPWVVRSKPLPQRPPKPGESESDIRHPFEETNSCLLYRWNDDLEQWEVWWNNGWKKSAGTYMDRPDFVPEEPKTDDDHRFVTYDATWAEPYEYDQISEPS